MDTEEKCAANTHLHAQNCRGALARRLAPLALVILDIQEGLGHVGTETRVCVVAQRGSTMDAY